MQTESRFVVPLWLFLLPYPFISLPPIFHLRFANTHQQHAAAAAATVTTTTTTTAAASAAFRSLKVASTLRPISARESSDHRRLPPAASGTGMNSSSSPGKIARIPAGSTSVVAAKGLGYNYTTSAQPLPLMRGDVSLGAHAHSGVVPPGTIAHVEQQGGSESSSSAVNMSYTVDRFVGNFYAANYATLEVRPQMVPLYWCCAAGLATVAPFEVLRFPQPWGVTNKAPVSHSSSSIPPEATRNGNAHHSDAHSTNASGEEDDDDRNELRNGAIVCRDLLCLQDVVLYALNRLAPDLASEFLIPEEHLENTNKTQLMRSGSIDSEQISSLMMHDLEIHPTPSLKELILRLRFITSTAVVK